MLIWIILTQCYVRTIDLTLIGSPMEMKFSNSSRKKSFVHMLLPPLENVVMYSFNYVNNTILTTVKSTSMYNTIIFLFIISFAMGVMLNANIWWMWFAFLNCLSFEALISQPFCIACTFVLQSIANNIIQCRHLKSTLVQEKDLYYIMKIVTYLIVQPYCIACILSLFFTNVKLILFDIWFVWSWCVANLISQSDHQWRIIPMSTFYGIEILTSYSLVCQELKIERSRNWRVSLKR